MGDKEGNNGEGSGDPAANLATVQAALETEREEHAATKLLLEKAQGDLAAATKAARAPKATAKPANPRARKVGPLDKAPDAQTLSELLAAGGMFELVPSDGKKEVLAMPPVQIDGNAWIKSGDRMKLTLPVCWCPTSAVSVAGFGLFDDDGEQIAYQALPEPMKIPAGQETSFHQAIHF